MKVKHIHIAKSPCWPPYGVIVEYTDGRELWDCASGTEADALGQARREYPRRKVLMWDSKKHYSNRKTV